MRLFISQSPPCVREFSEKQDCKTPAGSFCWVKFNTAHCRAVCAVWRRSRDEKKKWGCVPHTHKNLMVLKKRCGCHKKGLLYRLQRQSEPAMGPSWNIGFHINKETWSNINATVAPKNKSIIRRGTKLELMDHNQALRLMCSAIIPSSNWAKVSMRKDDMGVVCMWHIILPLTSNRWTEGKQKAINWTTPPSPSSPQLALWNIWSGYLIH